MNRMYTAGSKRIKVSLARRFIIDLLHFSKKIPVLPMQRTMQLRPLVEMRSRTQGRSISGGKVSWSAIFIRAFAILSERHPEFRRTYSTIPWTHFYENGASVASFSVEREWKEESVIVYGQVVAPETKSLLEIDGRIRALQRAPLESVGNFQAAMRLSRLPTVLRRLVWWYALSDGVAKSHFFGTFGISVVAGYGAASLTLLSPLTTTINYGVIEPDGSLAVRLMYDHRVMDGAFVARCMAELEGILTNEIFQELGEIVLGQVDTVPQAAESMLLN